MMSQLWVLFFLQVGMIFIKAFQQRNVAHDHKMYAFFTAYVFAAFEMATTGIVAAAWLKEEYLFATWAAMSNGAAIGVVAAISVHKRLTSDAVSK